MKTAPNYLSPLPPQEQRSLATWYAYSVYILIGLGALLMLINAYQYIQVKKSRATYQAIQSNLQQLQQQSQELGPLQKKSDLLQKRIDTLHNIIHRPFNAGFTLQELAKHLPGDVCLTEYTSSQDGKIAFQGYTPKAESVVSCMQALNKSPSLDTVTITSLTPAQSPGNEGQWFQFQIKGTLKKIIQ